MQTIASEIPESYFRQGIYKIVYPFDKKKKCFLILVNFKG